MASLVSPILDIFIVVHYLLVKTWFSLVLKARRVTQLMLTYLSVGYGQFAHALLSLWFILLAIPSWVLPALLPPFLGGGAIAIVAATTSVLRSSSSMAAIDSSACYLDTGCTSIMTNNSSLLFGASPLWVPITTGNSGALTSASFQGTARFKSPFTRRSFAFDQSLYCEQLPCTLVPLTVMSRSGLKSVLDEDLLAF